MATIKNTIETQFTSKGAQKTVKETESIGRAQTRMGQASASAGRSFAAQSSGLGGLVGVYAGAAANVFAITAAFDALGRAAQAETIVQGTKTLAIEIAASGSRILASVQEITQAQLTLAEASQNINIALSAGFNTQQIEDLSEISLKASRALGRNLTDAFQRVVRGAAKLEPELLDELGIFTRIDPAVEAYANKLNIASNSLTNYEKRQAFVNAVIEEGTKKFATIDTSASSAQKSFEQLRVQLTELATDFGQLIANGLAPLADFFTNNMGSALVLFGGILTLVFGKALESVGGFAAGAIKSLGSVADALSDKGAFDEKAITNATTAAQKGFKDGGIAGIRGQVKADQDPQQIARFRAAQTAIAQGEVNTQSELRKTNDALKEQRNQFNKNSKSYKALNTVINTNSAALGTASIQTRIFSGAAGVAQFAVTGLARAFSVLQASLGVIAVLVTAVQLLGSIAGKDFFGSIVGFFKRGASVTAEFTDGIKGLAVASSNLRTELSFLKASEIDDLFKIAIDAENTSIDPSRVGLGFKKTDGTRDLSNAKTRNFREVADKEVLKFLNEIEEIGINSTRDPKTNETAAGTSTEAYNTLSAELKRVIKLSDRLKDEIDKGANANQNLIKVLNAVILGYKKFGDTAGVIGGVQKSLGLSGEETARLFEKQLIVSTDLQDAVLKLIPNLNLTGKAFSDLSDLQQKLIENTILVEKALSDSNTSFERGSATSESLAKKLGGVNAALAELREQVGGVLGGGIVDKDELKKLEAQRDALQSQVRVLKNLETQGKAITDTFGKFFKVVDQAVQSGLMGTGGIAQTAAEQAENQVKFLEKQIKDGLNADKNGDSKQVLLAENRVKAIKALLGLALELPKAVQKEIDKRDKLTKQLQQQTKLLKAQNDLASAKGITEFKASLRDTDIENRQQSVDIQEKEFKLAELKNTATQKGRDLEIQLLNIRKQGAAEALRAADQTNVRGFNRAAGGRSAAIDAQSSRIADMEAFPNLSSQQQ